MGLVGVMAAAAFAESWDDALEETSVRTDAGQTLRLEVEKLRAKGMRYAFQPPPEGTVHGSMLKAELPEPNNWKTGGKSGGLESRGGKAKNAVIRFPVIKPGLAVLWFQYLDSKRQKNYTGAGALVVTFRQDGKELGVWKMPRSRSPLCDRAGWHKYGVGDLALGFPIAVWQDAAVVVPKAGEVEAELSVVDGGSYALYSWLATSDPLYEPRFEDFNPLWIRFTSLPGETVPFKPYLYRNICNRAPIRCTITNAVPPGGNSGWFYGSRFAGASEFTFGGAPNRFVRLELSTVPDEKGVFYREDLNGHGNRFALRISGRTRTPDNDVPYEVHSYVTESARVLREVRALPPQKGRLPRRFPFELPGAIGVESYEPFLNEMNISLELGCNVQPALFAANVATNAALDALRRRFLPIRPYRSPLPFGYYENGYDKCICSVKREEIAKWTKKVYEGTSGAGASAWWDEPTGRAHRDCVIPCTKAYREFLREMKLTPNDVGVKGWDEVFPVMTADPKGQQKSMDAFAEKFRFKKEKAPKASLDEEVDIGLDESSSEGGAPAGRYDPEKAPERFYWSQRYHLTKLRRFLSFATAEVEKYNREVLGGACLSPDIVDFHDGIGFGTDWFDFFEHRGFNQATSEDWHNVSRDFSVCGFLVDFLRGCTRRQGQPIRMVTVMCGKRTPWQVTAKAFAEIGHGAKDIWFYGYGPSYARSAESASDVPGMLEAIRAVTYPVGAVEDVLLDGRKASAPIAQLYSVSADICAHADGKAGRNGADRVWTNLLLTHLGRDVDVINEDGLFDHLKGYRFLWCGETAIRRACVKPLEDWIAAGGTLFLAEGSLGTDELGRELGFGTKAGGRGKGRVISVRRLGNAYRGSGRRNGPFGTQAYPDDVRKDCALVLDQAGVPVSVKSSVYNVEAHLYRGRGADALVVANWTGVATNVVLTLSGAYRGVEAYNAKAAVGRSVGKDYKIVLKDLPAGDCLKLVK